MNIVKYILALSLFGLSSGDARADGGIMLAHGVEGPFVVTTFSTSEAQQDRPVDVSVMIQEGDSSEPILDATVKLTFTSPAASSAEPVDPICGASEMPGMDASAEQFTVEATRGQASNKLLYAAPVKFDAAGAWQLQAFIKRDGDAEKITCSIPVGPPPRKLIALIPYLILPPLIVALFAINQWLRKQPWEKLAAEFTPSPRRSLAAVSRP